MITEGHEEELRELFEQNGVAVAYLFGSHARGQAHTLSDVDIGVLFPEDSTGDTRFKAILNLTTELGRIFGKEYVDVVEMERAPLPLLYRILRDGVIIYC